MERGLAAIRLAKVEVFWRTIALVASVTGILYSIPFLLYENIYGVSNSYSIIKSILTEREFGAIVLIVSLSTIIFGKSRILALILPIAAIFWVSTSMSFFISNHNRLTPMTAMHLSMAVFIGIAYFFAGGAKTNLKKGS